MLNGAVILTAISGDTTEAGGTATFTMTLDSAPTADVTIPLHSDNTSEGSLGAVTEVVLNSSNWDTGVQVTVTGVDDFVVDGGVAYSIVTGDPTSADANYGDLTATDVADVSVTNLDNDSAEFTVSSESGNEDDGSITFTVTLSNAVDVATSVDVSTSDGEALLSDSDYTQVSSLTLNFAAGVTSQTFTVTPTADTKVELDETFSVSLTNVVDGGRNVTASATSGTGTIVNDDSAEFTVSSESGNEDDGSITFTVTLSNAVDVATSVDVSTSDGEALLSDSDYTQVSSLTLNFAAGVTSQTFTVMPTADTKVELDETFNVNLSNVVDGGRNVTASATSGTGTIVNDDSAEFTVSSESGNEDDGSITFTVTLSNAVDVATSVDVSTSDGEALLSDSDYTQVSSLTLNFAAGVTSQTFTVMPTADTKVELDETFNVSLSNVVDGGRNVTASTTSGTGTIVNDDSAEFTVSSESGNEDDGSITFTVTLSNAVDVATSVDVSTSDGEALLSDSDYTQVSSLTLNFAAGVTSQTFTVMPTADTKVEPDETFNVSLSNVVDGGRNVTASATPGTGTITNDDTALAIAADQAAKAEGDTGNTPFTFTVTRSGVVSGTTSVNYAVTGSGANFADAADFGNSLPSGTINFGTSSTTKTITIRVKGDVTVEPDEGFTVTLSNASGGATITTDTASSTITNDDTALAIAADQAAKAEGGAGNTSFTFTVTRSGDVSGATSVNYAVTGSGANLAGAADFGGSLPSGTVTFAADDTSETITITVSGDVTVEPDEGFTVTLSNASGGTITTDTASSTITNDDALIVEFNQALGAADENSGGNLPTLLVTGEVQAGHTVAVDVTIDGSSTATGGGDDYTDPATVNVSGGSYTAMTFAITDLAINGDTLVEPDETIVLNIDATPVNVSAGTQASTSYTITNDDALSVEFNQASGSDDENSGGNLPQLLVTGDVQVGHTVAVNVTVDGSSTANGGGDDYTDPATVNVSGGSYTAMAFTITSLAIQGDTLVEPDETIVLNVDATPLNVSVGTQASTSYTITNDDALSVEFNQALGSDDENSGGNLPQLLVTGDVQAGYTVAVNVTVDGSSTATSGTDYTAPTGVTVTSGSYTATAFTIPELAINGDTLVEPDETIVLNVDATPLNVSAGTQSSTSYTITNDDALTVEFNQASGSDDENSGGNLPQLLVTGDVQDGHTVAVDVTVDVSGTATGGGDDYTDPATVNVSGGSYTAMTFTITGLAIQGDTLVEPDETIVLNIDATPVNVSAGTQASTSYTITNDDALIVEFNQASGSDDENSGGNLPQLLVTGDVQAGHTVAVNVTVDGTSTATGGGNDYTDATTLDVTGGTYTATAFTIPDLVIQSDTLVEPDETIVLNVDATPLNVSVGTQASTSYTITNDDALSVEFNQALGSDDENSGGNLPQLLVTGDVQAGYTVAVDVTVDGSSTATSGTDYTAPTGVTVTSGSYTATAFAITDLAINGDTLVEPDETIVLNIDATPVNVSAGTQASTSYTITNDDALIVEFNQASGSDDESSGSNLPQLLVTGDVQAGYTVAVNVTVDGSSTATGGGDDYIDPATVNVSGGSYTATTFAINGLSIVDDDIVEPTETIKLIIGNTQDDVTTGDADGDATTQINTVYTINDDITDPWIKIDGTGQKEILTINATGASAGTYTLNRNGSDVFVDIPFTAVTTVTFNGDGDNNKLLIDHSTDDLFAPANGITFVGGGGNDSVEVNGGLATTVTHTLSTDDEGTIDWDGTILTYSGATSITDGIGAENRVFQFEAVASETITISDDSDISDGESLVDSAHAAAVTFASPATSLTIEGGPEDTLLIANSPIEFTNGNLTVTGGTIQVNTSVTAAGNIHLQGTGDVNMAATGSIVANSVSIESTGGSIIDNTISENANITAATAVLIAANGIGGPYGSGDDIDVAVGTIAATTNSGDIVLDNVSTAADPTLYVGTVNSTTGITNLSASGKIAISGPLAILPGASLQTGNGILTQVPDENTLIVDTPPPVIAGVVIISGQYGDPGSQGHGLEIDWLPNNGPSGGEFFDGADETRIDNLPVVVGPGGNPFPATGQNSSDFTRAYTKNPGADPAAPIEILVTLSIPENIIIDIPTDANGVLVTTKTVRATVVSLGLTSFAMPTAITRGPAVAILPMLNISTPPTRSTQASAESVDLTAAPGAAGAIGTAEYFLTIVFADGQESDQIPLGETLDIPEVASRLPNHRYRIYFRQEDGTLEFVKEIIVRDGVPREVEPDIAPGDSEPSPDNPPPAPTEEAAEPSSMSTDSGLLVPADRSDHGGELDAAQSDPRSAADTLGQAAVVGGVLISADLIGRTKERSWEEQADEAFQKVGAWQLRRPSRWLHRLIG